MNTENELYYRATQIPVVEALDSQNPELIEKCLAETEEILREAKEKHILLNYRRTLQINIRLLRANLDGNMQLKIF